MSSRLGFKTRAGQISSITQGGGPFDPDANTFIIATGIADSVIRNAVNQLVIDLKNFSLWSKITALYPFVGGTSTTHMYNLKDARNDNMAFRLGFVGGWTHTSNGVQGNGTNAYADTYFVLGYNMTNSLTTSNGISCGVYSLTNSQRQSLSFGGADGSFRGVSMALRWTDDGNYWAANSAQISATSITDSRGFFIVNRFSDTTVKLYRNGSAIQTVLSSQIIPPYYSSIFLNARNQPKGVPDIQWYDNRQYALFYIGFSMTDADIVNFYTAVQTFQTTLGRQV